MANKLGGLYHRHRALGRGVVAALLVVAALAGGLVGASRTETVYQSRAVVMVIPPGAGSDVATLNPFVNMTQNLSMLGNALVTALNSPNQAVGATPAPASITNVEIVSMKDDTTQNAQVTSQVSIAVQGTDAAATQKYGAEVIKQAAQVLHRIQFDAGVRGATFADLVTLASPSAPEKATGSALRAAVSAAGVAVVLMALVLAGVYGCAVLVRRARGQRQTVDDSDDAITEPASPSTEPQEATVGGGPQ